MVLLTITPTIISAVERCRDVAASDFAAAMQAPAGPSLDQLEPGNPISHYQLVAVTKLLKANMDKISTYQDANKLNLAGYRLCDLLRGSALYSPPPKPRPEPTPEYKELMSRLRREEEARSYERMLNPLPATETFAERFGASYTNLFPVDIDTKEEDDELTYADINRQIALIINVLISIIACSVALWLAARYWSTPKRLALSMIGSIVVAIAEVVIYGGYLRRIQEAKQKEKRRPEFKEVLETWVIDSNSKDKTEGLNKDNHPDSVRFRKGKHR